jgi:serine/threonine protein phosphatase PrpC
MNMQITTLKALPIMLLFLMTTTSPMSQFVQRHAQKASELATNIASKTPTLYMVAGAATVATGIGAYLWKNRTKPQPVLPDPKKRHHQEPISPEEQSQFSWGVSVRQSSKKDHLGHDVDEDRYRVIPSINGNKRQAIFALFDGHLGESAANFAAKQLPNHLVESITANPTESKIQLLQSAFKQTEQDLKGTNADYAGTTASVAYLENSDLYLSWLGDSRIMVLTPDGQVIESTEHKPTNPTEIKRLTKLPCDKDSWASQSVTRAFGQKWMRDNRPGIIIAEPENLQVKLPENSIVVIASDGLWNFLSTEQTTKLVKKFLSMNTDDLKKRFPLERDHEASYEAGTEKMRLVARALIDCAYRLHHSQYKWEHKPDNVSAIVITNSAIQN